MYEELLDDEIIKKVGGRFKLSTLIQKRMVALMKGAKPLVNLDTQDRMKIVLQEILQDKIYLDMDQNVRVRTPSEAPGPPEFNFNNL